MRVVRVDSFGPPDSLQIHDAPDPAAGPGEVMIEVAIAPVLYIDTVIRAGNARDLFPQAVPPYVPGMGVAGTVAAVGPGVDPAWIGRRVVADTPGGGGYLELAVAAVDAVVPIPAGVDITAAAAVLHDGRTAVRLLDVHTPSPGDWVLVNGAGGAAALLITQLAVRAGAQVIGAARSTEKLDRARTAGAAAVVDYTDPGWTTKILEITDGKGPRIVFDGVGGAIGRAAFDIVAAGGRFSAHGTPGGGFAPIDPHEADSRGISVTGIEAVHVEAADAKRLITTALEAVAANEMKPVIAATYSLARAAEGHDLIERRAAIGKVLLEAQS